MITEKNNVFYCDCGFSWRRGMSGSHYCEDRLRAKLAESQREFRAADATIHNLELKLTDMAVQLANAESKCRELAAENAGLKSLSVKLYNYGYLNGHHHTVEGYFTDIHRSDIDSYHSDVVEEIIDEETPATDAFLAEVRAQWVEIFSEKFGGGTLLSDMVKETAKEFAAQLRKGVQS